MEILGEFWNFAKTSLDYNILNEANTLTDIYLSQTLSYNNITNTMKNLKILSLMGFYILTEVPPEPSHSRKKWNATMY